MTNFSLAFPPKRPARLIIFIICLIILSQVYFSLYLFRYMHKVFNNIDSKLGKIYFSSASFDIINGFNLNDVAIIDNSTPPQILFQAKKLSFGFNRIDIFKKKMNISRIRFVGSTLYADEKAHTFSKLSKIVQAAFLEFLKNQLVPLDLEFNNPSFNIRSSKVIFADWSGGNDGYWVVKLDSRVSMEGNKIYSKGSADLEYKFSSDAALVSFFENQLFSQNFKYELRANLKDNDFIIEIFDIALGYDHLRGQAIIKNLNSPNPMISLIINTGNLSIENISSLVKDPDTRGTFNASAIVRGPLDKFKFLISLNFLGCTFRYQSLPVFRNIVGKVYWTGEAIKAEDCFLIVKDIPLKVNSDISWAKDVLKLSLNASVKQPVKDVDFLPRSLRLDFVGQMKGKDTLGNADVSVEARDDNVYSFKIEDFKLSAEKNKRQLLVKSIGYSGHAVSKPEGKKRLNFSGLSANFGFSDKGFKVESLKVSGLGGKLNADLNVAFLPGYEHLLHFRADGLNAAQIQDGLNLPYNLLGDISARIISSSRGNKFFQGVLMVKNGKLQETAVLLALSDYMKIGSLKTIEFDNLQLNFSFLKDGSYRYGAFSRGKDAILRANIQIDKDRQLSSYLNANFSQNILVESAQFRRLLKMIGQQSRFVEFPFVISGTIHNPRLQWLRNDFKRSLERVIPAWYRRNMQNEINSVVDEMPANNN